MGRTAAMLRRAGEMELGLCLYCNRACDLPGIARLFTIISQLGNGIFWYSLVILLPIVFGSEALLASLHMSVIGAIGLVVYKLIKQYTRRRRPGHVHDLIRLVSAPLDYYSFPSGHTLHAVSFTIIALHYYPQLGLLLVPFAVLVAFSRVILGLHYPTDVFAGALIGATLALASLDIPLSTLAI